MRQTLHLLPSADFPIYITALKRSRRAALLLGMARFGMTATDLNGLNALVMESLQPGPMSQRDLTEAVKPRLNKRIRAWMERFWSILRPAVVEGLICYGPEQLDGKGRRNDAVFVRVDQWLPRQKGLDEMKDELTSQHILLRRYLQAYGPATLRDFSFWSGISMKESREIWNSLSQELAEVSIEGQKRSILGRDLDVLAKSVLDDEVVRLLPGFDPYLLAHAEKDHIVSSQHYKRVYRNQGWISPVILINGRVVGIWSCTRKGKALSCKVELFEKVSKLHRTKIQDEAESLGRFLGGAISISLTA